MSTNAAAVEVAPGVSLVDTGYGRPALAAAWIVQGARSAAVVETGTAHSVPRILAGLAARGIDREAVSEVIVTHVHLDHAAGAGALLRELPRARLVVHPRGARHMIDPSKLLAGAAAVYGGMDRIRESYGDVAPAPAERVVEAPEGFTVDLGGRVLRTLDAPGHARHHLVVHDPASRGFFTGDAFGVSYRELDVGGRPFVFPTTTPVQFEPEAMAATVDRMLAERPERMYLTHYGMLEGNVPGLAAELKAGVAGHVGVARAAPAGAGRKAALVAGLEELALRGLAAHGWTGTRARALEILGGDVELNAQGLEVWLDAQAEGKGAPAR